MVFTLPMSGRSSFRKRVFKSTLVLISFLFLLSCTGVSSGPGGGTGTNPATYTITVTGVSGGLRHSTTVQLIVE